MGVDVEGHPGIKFDSTIGRVYTVHPNQNECFFLRILLHERKGPTSFNSLKKLMVMFVEHTEKHV